MAVRAQAGQVGTPTKDAVPSSVGVEGPPAPLPPAVISRDGNGHATVRAVKLAAPLKLDGALDEDVYRDTPSISDFVQSEPNFGKPATQKTEFWIFFDRDAIYISARCWESNPERMIANEMRRDANNIGQGERIGFTIDTFHDRRNGPTFSVNPLGGRMDGQITDEKVYNPDWNPIWDAQTGRFDGGWTVETKIPFKSLRYKPGSAQTWAIAIGRHNRWKNEIAYVVPIPPAVRGLFQISMASTLVGLEVPSGARNLEVKPFITTNATQQRAGATGYASDASASAGLDLKYGVTQNLTADLTYNTDFAQVEADEQQVNLTRFSLFFPEKRDFFLENQGTFAFGGTPSTGQGVVGGDMPVLFYSRRIGLDAGQPIPIEAGGRLTGRVGRYLIGALNMEAGDEPVSRTAATNFSVLRVKRDFLRRSSIGALFTGRSVSPISGGSNQAYGIDGTFNFFDSLAINTYWARTNTEGLSGSDVSYRGHLDYSGDRYGFQAERMIVGEHFNPEVGFVRRSNMARNFGVFRFSPRPRGNPVIRKFSFTGQGTYIEDGKGHPETRIFDGLFGVEFHNGDLLNASVTHDYEYLARPFRLTGGGGVTVAPGGYDFASGNVSVTLGPKRRLSGAVGFEAGSFYDGHRKTFTYSRGRVNVTHQFSVEPNISVNWVTLPAGTFTAKLYGARVTYTMTPRMFASALIQSNSDGQATAVNARLRWEYRPGSELFVVYNEQRDAVGRLLTDLANRSFIVKLNWLFRL
ncbi:MAG: DUF5916 domain-containing protein [Vicinamibacterales bacterium]